MSLIFAVILAVFLWNTTTKLLFEPPQALAQQKIDNCQFYYDKAKQLAEESAEDLPQGITTDFDPRMAKSNSSIAYSWLYKNCKKYGE